jgi:hypothetical protein
MKFYDLKTNNKLPHHYIIGVIMEPMTAGKSAGKMILKYGPLYFHNDDVDRLRDALLLSQDKLFPTSTQDALSIHKVKGLVGAINGMKLACSMNLATMHHFSSDTTMDEDAFLLIVDLANKTDEGRKLLDDSKIGSTI